MIGIDIVYIPNIKKLMQNEVFIKKTFHSSETKTFTPEHLAGIFAAKEAFFKAINKKINWLNIEIKKEKSGKPNLTISTELKDKLKIQNIYLSISHDNDYAIAQVTLTTK
ncbi:holo-ACP synthase [Candidatus Woesearchaeota archaeon]|nr:holo-ACP synthase [Candidatus Woesearchaeota archaeon]